MHITKEDFLHHVVEAIGPDRCSINDLFDRLPKSLKKTFTNFDEFCRFVDKRSHLFEFFVVDGSIYVKKKMPLEDDNQSSSASNDSSSSSVSKSQLESYVVDVIEPGPCQLTELLQKLKGTPFANETELQRFIERRPHLFELMIGDRGVLVVQGRTAAAKSPSPDVPGIITNRALPGFGDGVASELTQVAATDKKQDLTELVLAAMNTEPCTLDILFDKLPKCTRSDISRHNLCEFLTERPNLFDLTSSNMVSCRLKEIELYDIKTKLLRKYFISHERSENMMVEYVGKVTSRRMAIFYKTNAKHFPVNMHDFIEDQEFSTVPGGINLKSMVDQLKIEEILMDFIVFLSLSPNQCNSVDTFYKGLTKAECVQFGLTFKDQRNQSLLAAVLGLFIFERVDRRLFENSSGDLKLIQDAFIPILNIATRVYGNSSSAIFNVLQKYWTTKFSDLDDLHAFRIKAQFKKDFRNLWGHKRHSQENSIIHIEDGKLYLLFRYEAFRELHFEDVLHDPEFFLVPDVGFHIKGFISYLGLDKLLVKIIRLLLLTPMERLETKEAISEIGKDIGKGYTCPETKSSQTFRTLIETIINLSPEIFCQTDFVTSLRNDEPDVCGPTRLVLEILRAQVKIKPTTMRNLQEALHLYIHVQLLYEALPEFAKCNIDSPAELEIFCQETEALRELKITTIGDEQDRDIELNVEPIDRVETENNQAEPEPIAESLKSNFLVYSADALKDLRSVALSQKWPDYLDELIKKQYIYVRDDFRWSELKWLFNVLPKDCRAEFKSMEDLEEYYKDFKPKLDIKNLHEEWIHTPLNSAIHLENGKFYLLIRFDAAFDRHFDFRTLRTLRTGQKAIFTVPGVGLQSWEFIRLLDLDTLLVKIIRLQLQKPSKNVLGECVKLVSNGRKSALYPRGIQHRLKLIDTIFKLFPNIFNSHNIKDINDKPEGEPSRERLILEILRAQEKSKPKSTQSLFQALPDFVKDHFRFQIELENFCQEMVDILGWSNEAKLFSYTLKSKKSITYEEPPKTSLTLENIQNELKTLANESINQNSTGDVRAFIKGITDLSKKAEEFGRQKDEEFLCDELAPIDDSPSDNSVIEI